MKIAVSRMIDHKIRHGDDGVSFLSFVMNSRSSSYYSYAFGVDLALI
jgi:hypothetical protein